MQKLICHRKLEGQMDGQIRWNQYNMVISLGGGGGRYVIKITVMDTNFDINRKLITQKNNIRVVNLFRPVVQITNTKPHFRQTTGFLLDTQTKYFTTSWVNNRRKSNEMLEVHTGKWENIDAEGWFRVNRKVLVHSI